MKTRYAVVGIGGRSRMYTSALKYDYADRCELVAMCDMNSGRLEERNRWFVSGQPPPLPPTEKTGPVNTYPAEKFNYMIEKEKVDVVVVTTMDRYHDDYIVRAMEAGCDVISEKPLTITAEKLQRIIDTAKRTGKNLTVTFNYRYSPVRTTVKKVLSEGIIGKVISADFGWNLDTYHGADYFRRWHRKKENSGGLLVHKATHHFDLINWWLDAIPAEVYCRGERNFYIPEQAERYGLRNRTERCLNCPESSHCKFYLDLKGNEIHRRIYLDQERHDGYHRDRCVFSDDIDIEDTICAVVKYNTGVMMSYTLNAFMPWEGYTVAINGTRGRLEHTAVETVYISGDGRVPGQQVGQKTNIVVHPHFGTAYTIPFPKSKGGHGGGDEPLLEDIFGANAGADPLGRMAGLKDGAFSVLTGIAANKSIQTGSMVKVGELVRW